MAPSHARRARFSIAAIFFLANAAFSNWLARIPSVQERLHIDEAQFGLCLFGMSVGSISMMAFSGGLVARLGARRGALLGFGAFVVALLGPGLAPTAPVLFLALIPVGAAWAVTHVGLNTVAHETEEASGKRLMATCHGLFSLGGMAGATVGSLLARLNIDVPTHFAGVLGVILAAGMAVGRFLHASTAPVRQESVRFALPSRTLAGLCFMMFTILLIEGSVSEWSALLLRNDFGAGPGLAGLGVSAFSLAMATGRFGGDWLSHQLSVTKLLRAGASLACLGLALGLITRSPVLMLVSLACTGLGLANLIPGILRTAAERGERPAAVNIAAVSTVGQLAFLIGPPLMGLLSRTTSISMAFWMLATMAAGVALLAGRSTQTAALLPEARP